MWANQSRHTVQFSELAWDDAAPQFPQAWMIGKYLERYLDRFLTGNPDFELKLGTKVERAERPGGSSEGWDITTGSETKHFDHLLVASGFFGKPIIPDCLAKESTIPIIHSSSYRDLESLLGKGRPGGGKILIVGGQMSGVEIAGTIASHLSSEINSPDASRVADIDKYEIHNVIQRPTWVFPLFSSPKVGRHLRIQDELLTCCSQQSQLLPSCPLTLGLIISITAPSHWSICRGILPRREPRC